MNPASTWLRLAAVAVLCGVTVGCGKEEVKSADDFAADLQNEDPEVRIAAAKGLAVFGPGAVDAVPNMLAALKSDQDPKVRAAVAEVFWALGSEASDALPELEKLQYSEKDPVTAANLMRAVKIVKGEPVP